LAQQCKNVTGLLVITGGDGGGGGDGDDNETYVHKIILI
jgi:hypothetical protein